MPELNVGLVLWEMNLLMGGFPLPYQWPFQDPKLEVPTIYKAYFSGLCKGISLQNKALYGTGIPTDIAMFDPKGMEVPSLSPGACCHNRWRHSSSQ